MTEETKNAPPPVKGSWEDLLTQAGRLAANQNDEALPIYEKLVTRLRALPAAQRQASKGRLQNLLKIATINYHTYLSTRERYDEALALIPGIQQLEDENNQDNWEYHAASLLYQAGRTEEALARLRTRIETPEAPVVNWGQLAMMYLRLHQADSADQTLEEMAQRIETERLAGQTSATQLGEEQALLAGLRANVALDRGDWSAATTYFDQATALDSYYKENPHILYIRLARQKQYETALRYIQNDHHHAVRSGFWHGYVLYHQDKNSEARRQWQKVIGIDVEKTKERSLMEFVLAHYYLGDPEAVALGGVIRLLKEERGASWELLYMAALGWALRGNVQDARANLTLAIVRRKALAEGTHLPHESWLHCQDLLSAELQAQLAEYFEPE
jgi:tetratricopeptide (TPR) repeat protein